MTTCSSDMITKGCQCLANPTDPGSQVCAYINRQNGLVSPCDSGCCVPRCKINTMIPSILQFQNEFLSLFYRLGPKKAIVRLIVKKAVMVLLKATI